MPKRIVIALGGNALGNTPYEQLALVTETAKPIVDLIEAGNEVIIAHGNGPQVGMINLGMSTAAEAGAIKSDMPFPECGAMSQGYIGYHLQNAIGNELAARGLTKDVATVVTQVLVDEADPAFQHPTKPVGAFYDKETAEKIAAEKGYTMVEDAGRGYRQVVPSPKPIDVIEKNTVRALLKAGTVVITV
ncbi:MAG: carbamate kinase, partial [Oscillospiraceae bacterium]|nr:carbamate kinase [Oscillospiraceae bacterium]